MAEEFADNPYLWTQMPDKPSVACQRKAGGFLKTVRNFAIIVLRRQHPLPKTELLQSIKGTQMNINTTGLLGAKFFGMDTARCTLATPIPDYMRKLANSL